MRCEFNRSFRPHMVLHCLSDRGRIDHTLFDHTLFRPEATSEQIKQYCVEAKEHKFASVCINPSGVKQAAEWLKEDSVIEGVKLMRETVGPEMGVKAVSRPYHPACWSHRLLILTAGRLTFFCRPDQRISQHDEVFGYVIHLGAMTDSGIHRSPLPHAPGPDDWVILSHAEVLATRADR